MAANTARDLSSEIVYLTRALKAPTLRDSVDRLAERARAESWSHLEFLVACLQREVAARESHVAAIAILVFVGTALVILTTVRTARHQAETAADLAALAGASEIVAFGSDPCAAAATVARANGAELVSCEVNGEMIAVHVSRPVTIGGLSLGSANARARAGPAGPDG